MPSLPGVHPAQPESTVPASCLHAQFRPTSCGVTNTKAYSSSLWATPIPCSDLQRSTMLTCVRLGRMHCTVLLILIGSQKAQDSRDRGISDQADIQG